MIINLFGPPRLCGKKTIKKRPHWGRFFFSVLVYSGAADIHRLQALVTFG